MRSNRSSASNSTVTRASRARRLALAVGVALALATTAACGGSMIDPKEAAEANQAFQGQAGPGSGGVLPGDAAADPGAAPATDSGAPGEAGSGQGGSAGAPGASGNSGGGSGAGGGTAPVNAQGGGGIAAKAGSCAGFKNQKGITDKTITIGNSADISGPVPGLFQATQQATKAYVEYFNQTSSICGRKLELKTYDSRTDAGADQQSYQRICDETFASVGSMSAFDSGGAAVAQKCGLPDIRTSAVTLARNACTTCFGVQATGEAKYQNAVYDFWIRKDKAVTQKAAFLYLNAGAAAENAKTQIAVGKKRGMNFVYTSPIDVADFNYGPYVQQMKSKGVRWVQFLGAYQQSARLAQAMQSANFKPDVRFYDPSVYEPGFLKQGGSAVEGVVFFVNFTPLYESQPEINLYKTWLQRVSPGAIPTFFGMFAWSSAKLFVEKSIQLGAKLNRASLINEIKGVRAWVGGGMHSRMDVGGKNPPECVRMLTVKGGKFANFGSTSYFCNGFSRAN